jgi:hypothetical protein
MQEVPLLTDNFFSPIVPANILQVILVFAGSFWVAFFMLRKLSHVASRRSEE